MFNPIVRLFLILVLLFVCVGMVAAQEATPEPTPPTPVELPPDSVVTSGGQLLLLLGLAVLSGGGLLAVLYRFLESKQVLDTSEKLYQSTPPETQQFINDLVAGLHETTNRLLTYLDKITDGKPNE
ncbi:MAG: hypothetical protein K8L97_09870 [Anaerolineae bacterium]|nr:hypothetical protein [Anaerolineae bacterium]